MRLLNRASVLFSIAVILLFSLSFDANAQIDLGMRISSFKKSITDSSSFISLSQSEIKVCYKLLYKKVRYEVTLTKDRRIDYVGTSDLNFVSPEGVNVNAKFSAIPNPRNGKVIESDLWWSKYLKLQSGWYAAFKSGREVNKDSPVLYLFKKNL